MTSPINNINRSSTDALSSSTSKTRSKESAESKPTTSAPTADTVSLSEETVHIRELQQKLDSISEVDSEKVEAIKQEIAKGNYPIDSNKIAANLIDLEKALIE